MDAKEVVKGKSTKVSVPIVLWWFTAGKAYSAKSRVEHSETLVAAEISPSDAATGDDIR